MALTIGVLGGGAWGSTLASLMTQAGHRVAIWRRSQGREALQALESVELLVGATALVGVTEVAQQVKGWAARPLLSCSKGPDPDSGKTASGLWARACPSWPIVVLSGPNLASELQQGLPAASVLAGHDNGLLTHLQQQLSSEQFRLYRNNDPLGTELAGGLKNVMAIAAGICDGLKLGANARASLLTRALAEMSRFAVKQGANPLTFLGLSGVGDLFATCNSPLSRNYQIGFALGSGKTLDDATKALGQTAEGINTIVQVRAKAEELDVYMPITNALYEVIFENAPPMTIALSLMKNGHRSDVEFVLPHHEV